MKHYNIDEFVWFDPSPTPRMTVSFPRERYISMNAPLFKELGRFVNIAFHPTDKAICIKRATEENGIKLTTSGVITSAELSEKMISVGICPPTKLNVRRQGEYWIAVVEPERIPDAVSLEKPNKQPRKTNPVRILNGIDGR